MKNILFLLLLSALTFTSCSDDPSTNDDGETVLPLLEFSYKVSGHTTQSDDWESPENNPELGGHSNGVISNHSVNQGAMSVSGTGPEYGFTVNFETQRVETGSFTLTNATFNNSSGAYANFQAGTFKIEEAELNFTANGQTYYTISGSFTASIRDGFTPPNTIELSADFIGLSVISN